MLALALHCVCRVMNPVVPGVNIMVITSSATPPTVKVGALLPIPAPVLFTFTEYPPGELPPGKLVEQYTRNGELEVHFRPAGLVPGIRLDTSILENGSQVVETGRLLPRRLLTMT